ncbi:MAG: hypothetical protein Q8L10_01740 [Candidatus Moranbacteria bacterium]|nr:hypothetical protein [Candidatus Moranbacteria bacterium]
MPDVNYGNHKERLDEARQSLAGRAFSGQFGNNQEENGNTRNEQDYKDKSNNADGSDAHNNSGYDSRKYQNDLNRVRSGNGGRNDSNESTKFDRPDGQRQGEIGSAAENARRLKRISGSAASGRGGKALSEAIKLGLDLRRQIEEGKDIPFVFLIILASAGDVIDLLNLVMDAFMIGIVVPPLGIITRSAIFVIMFLSLWGKGAFIKKIVVRILMVTVIESIPIFPFSLIAVLPIETLTILWIWHNTHKKIKKAEARLKGIGGKIKKNYPSIIEELKNISTELLR